MRTCERNHQRERKKRLRERKRKKSRERERASEHARARERAGASNVGDLNGLTYVNVGARPASKPIRRLATIGMATGRRWHSLCGGLASRSLGLGISLLPYPPILFPRPNIPFHHSPLFSLHLLLKSSTPSSSPSPSFLFLCLCWPNVKGKRGGRGERGIKKNRECEKISRESQKDIDIILKGKRLFATMLKMKKGVCLMVYFKWKEKKGIWCYI